MDIFIVYFSLTKQPDYIYRIISLDATPCKLRSSNYTVLTEPSFRRKTRGKRRYYVCTSLLWNKLHPSPEPLTNTFKHKLKKYLIDPDILTSNIFVSSPRCIIVCTNYDFYVLYFMYY